MSKKKLAVEIAWSELLLYGGEWKTCKAIYEELLAEGFERRYVDWYLFCLSEHQTKENTTMDDHEEQETISVDRLINLINRAHDMGKILANRIARGTGGREVALSLTNLEQARHWARDAKALLQGDKEE